MCVWNLLRSVWKSIDFLYNSIDLFSFGIKRIDIWLGFGNSQTHFLLWLS